MVNVLILTKNLWLKVKISLYRTRCRDVCLLKKTTQVYFDFTFHFKISLTPMRHFTESKSESCLVGLKNIFSSYLQMIN